MSSYKILLAGSLVALLWWLALFGRLIGLWYGDITAGALALALVPGLVGAFLLVRIIVKPILPTSGYTRLRGIVSLALPLAFIGLGLFFAKDFGAWPKAPEPWIMVWTPLGSGVLQLVTVLILHLAVRISSVLLKPK